MRPGRMGRGTASRPPHQERRTEAHLAASADRRHGRGLRGSHTDRIVAGTARCKSTPARRQLQLQRLPSSLSSSSNSTTARGRSTGSLVSDCSVGPDSRPRRSTPERWRAGGRPEPDGQSLDHEHYRTLPSPARTVDAHPISITRTGVADPHHPCFATGGSDRRTRPSHIVRPISRQAAPPFGKVMIGDLLGRGGSTARSIPPTTESVGCDLRTQCQTKPGLATVLSRRRPQ